MKIEEIKDPHFLKWATTKELKELAKDIRSFLVDTVSKTGGHLSSNLGIVEITIALHTVFNTPKDKILFDVGHQSYVHKILTGRANKMNTLRQFNGLSGFQKRYESEYDCFEAGHSSTALSSALGMAVARDLRNERYEIIPVVGDGALMSGLSLEALNQIGYEKKKIIIIFNDNNMSISKNVGALNKSFARMRSSVAYNELKYNVKEYLKENNKEKVISKIHNAKESIKKSIINSGIFGEFGIDYLGPIDGHNIDALIKAFKTAQNSSGPIVVHCITKKGKGYKYTEEDRTGLWHGVGKFDVKTGKFMNNATENCISYSKLVANTVEEMMDNNKDIVAITPAMITGSCLNNLFAKYPKRSFDCGIAEDHAIEFSSGLALNKMHPFVSVYSSFLQRSYDEINQDLCRMDLPCLIGIDRAGLVGEDGPTHHGTFDISILNPLPNMIIAQGKDSNEIRNLIYTAFNTNHPFALRYPRGNTQLLEKEDFKELELGKWEYEYNNKNRKAVIITYGNDVVSIAKIVKENKLNYSVVNARYIKPIDEHILKQIASYNVPIFVYTTDIIKGGLGDSILAFYNANKIKTDVTIMGIDDQYVTHGSLAQLKESLGLDINHLLKKIEEKC